MQLEWHSYLLLLGSTVHMWAQLKYFRVTSLLITRWIGDRRIKDWLVGRGTYSINVLHLRFGCIHTWAFQNHAFLPSFLTCFCRNFVQVTNVKWKKTPVICPKKAHFLSLGCFSGVFLLRVTKGAHGSTGMMAPLSLDVVSNSTTWLSVVGFHH